MFALKVMFYKIIMHVTRIVIMLGPQSKPTLYTGSGSSLKLARAITQYGSKKILIVTDKILVELGYIQPIQEYLESKGVAVCLFDGVEPDPSFGVVEAGMDVLKRNGCDSVLAIGGGSSIDAGKVMALAVADGRDPRKLEGLMKARKAALPLYAIPTTAGTGSEVTVAAVITDTNTATKCVIIDPKTVPVGAALDPEIMKGMPRGITAATGMDALTHAIEAYLSYISTAKTDADALISARLIIKNLTKAYDDGSDIEAREAVALGSFYGGMRSLPR